MSEARESQPSHPYRELYDDAACGLLSTAASGTITNVNHTFCAWIGRDREELVGCKRVQDLLTIGSKIFHQTHWMPLLSIQGSVAEVQLEMLHVDGRILPVLINVIRRSEGGAVRDDLAVFLLKDRRSYEHELLLARKRAEELLERERAAQDALAKVLRERGEEARQRAVLAERLVGIVSHDLRTPLNTISIGTGVLNAGGTTGAQTRIVSRMANAVNRATRLTQDLLDFTQAGLGGGLRVARRTFDVAAVIEECVDELRLAWPGRQVVYTHEGPREGYADPDRLTQVITNLINNALTYGVPQEPIQISSCIAPATSTPMLDVRVHNRGEAIPHELMPHLFEALRRGEKESKLGARSVGLGLYIVRQIALAHGGDVSVESTPGGGTTFAVRIPLAGRSATDRPGSPPH